MTINQKPEISVIIPVKNGAATLQKCLKGIFEQSLAPNLEVIIIDSGSTDNSLQIARSFDVRLIEILPNNFNHGDTRNFGITIANGEFVVLTVQDARPANNLWIETMRTHFYDSQVAAVCGQQVVPHETDKNPHQWFRPLHKPEIKTIQYLNPDEFLTLTPYQKWKQCSWDNVTSMYRKNILQKIPFQKVIFGEDMLWAKDAIMAGYKLIYDNNAQVYHYHHYNDLTKYKQRLQLTQYFVNKNFGYLISHSVSINDFLKVLYHNFKYKMPLKWIIYNFKLLFVKLTIKPLTKLDGS